MGCTRSAARGGRPSSTRARGGRTAALMRPGRQLASEMHHGLWETSPVAFLTGTDFVGILTGIHHNQIVSPDTYLSIDYHRVSRNRRPTTPLISHSCHFFHCVRYFSNRRPAGRRRTRAPPSRPSGRRPWRR